MDIGKLSPEAQMKIIEMIVEHENKINADGGPVGFGLGFFIIVFGFLVSGLLGFFLGKMSRMRY